jgi:hypothetical protein
MREFFRRIFISRKHRKSEPADSTPLSEFVRSSSRDKKKVYDLAIRRAADEQRKVVERHRECA